jgi:hypothetical protein
VTSDHVSQKQGIFFPFFSSDLAIRQRENDEKEKLKKQEIE